MLVVIVTFNSARHIRPCLEALEANQADLKLIVFDNASQDDSVIEAKSCRLATDVIVSDANIGFAAAVNRAASLFPEAEFIFLLNPDAILAPAALDTLLLVARDRPQHRLYGGVMHDPDGRIFSGAFLGAPTLWHAAAYGLGLSLLKGNRLLDPDAQAQQIAEGLYEVPVLTGGAMLIEGDLWRQSGGFDERFFLYGEDVDLCMRTREFGASPLIIDRATYLHAGGGSATCRSAYLSNILRGKAILYDTYVPKPWRSLARLFLLSGTALRAALEMLFRPGDFSWRQTWEQREGWRDGWT